MPQGEKPRAEPEIIPPDRSGRGAHRAQGFTDASGTERIRVMRVGPFGSILVVLITAILVAVMLALLLGVLLIWLPVLVLFVAGAIIVTIVRAYFRRGP
jgi:hypothetical protein